MKEFNLKAAKAGKPVCTRDGRPVRILCFDRKNESFPIVALIKDDDKEYPYSYTIEGKYQKEEGCDDPFDLMMASEKKEGWIILYKQDNEVYPSVTIFTTKDRAYNIGKNSQNYLTTIKIEWEVKI